MKRVFHSACFLLLTAFAFSFTGCIKDTCKRTYTYTYYEPVYKTSAEVRNNIRSNAPRSIEKPGKLFIRGNYIFLNEVDRGIHVINNANPASPQNVAFIDIPGNLDLAVKGNTLYADLYTDLVAIDVTNPLQATVSKFVNGVFPHRYFYNFRADTSKVIAEWIKRDTTVTQECGNNNALWLEDGRFFFSLSALNSGTGSAASASPYGVGGSMAKFSVASERLYTLGSNDLSVFNITNPAEPSFVSKSVVGWQIETLYPFRDKLFIGSTTGMFIYDISNPDQPSKLSQFAHVQSCDPVIADDRYAYVTLRSGTVCNGFTNQMDILKLDNLTNPVLEKTYQMTNPHGLSKDGTTLFLCDGRDGLKIYNAADPRDLRLIKHLTNLETFDVIAWHGVAIVVAKDGLYQYDYSDLNNIRLLSKLSIIKS